MQTNLRINVETRDQLLEFKVRGYSYDDVIRRMIKVIVEKNLISEVTKKEGLPTTSVWEGLK